MRNQFRAVLEFGFIFGKTLPRNSGAAASAPQSDGKLNRHQSFVAAACADNSIDDNQGFMAFFGPKC